MPKDSRNNRTPYFAFREILLSCPTSNCEASNGAGKCLHFVQPTSELRVHPMRDRPSLVPAGIPSWYVYVSRFIYHRSNSFIRSNQDGRWASETLKCSHMFEHLISTSRYRYNWAKVPHENQHHISRSGKCCNHVQPTPSPTTYHESLA
jgi:hypothetical protein